MVLHAAALSDVGRERTTNEDAYLCDVGSGVFVVCDGMGGAAAGEVASRHTVKAITTAVASQAAAMRAIASNGGSTEPIANAMRLAIEKACGELYAMGREDKAKRGMGSTCTALAVAGTRAVLAHVGDSRCYLLRGGVLTAITSDHTYVAEAVRNGIIKPGEAENAPFSHVLTRAVGPQKTVLVDVVAFDLAPGDSLLLCSDGLHQYFRDPSELGQHVAGANLDAVLKNLVGIANQRGGTDNITAVVVRVDETASRSRVGTLARVEALRHVDLLRDLDMAEVIRLCQAFEARDVPAGEFMIREGEQAESFFVLVDGTVEVRRGQQVITTLTSGSHFGEIALLGQRPRTASIRATTACHVLVTRRSTLFPFLEREPMLAAKVFYKLAQTLSLRLDDLYAQSTAPLAPGAVAGRETTKFGAYPSNRAPGPFPPRH